MSDRYGRSSNLVLTKSLCREAAIQGAVVREQSGKHSLLYATDEGIGMIEKINQAWDELYRRYADILGEEEGDELAKKIYAIGDQLSKISKNQ